MQRIAFPTLVTAFLAIGPAFAGPLNLNPQTQPAATSAPSGIGSIFATPPAAEPAPRMQLRRDRTELRRRLPRDAVPRPGGRAAPQRQPEPQNPDLRPRSHSQRPGRRRSVSARGRSIRASCVRKSATTAARRPARSSSTRASGMLYLVQGNGRAIRYGIGVGRPGFTWAGAHHDHQQARVAGLAPPAEMLSAGSRSAALHARRSRQSARRARDVSRLDALPHPRLERALDHRHAVSSGCIRMRNEDVIDLYGRVRVGTRVVVI